MRPSETGVVLTNSDEFVVYGEGIAGSAENTRRLPDNDAIVAAISRLRPVDTGKKPAWEIPCEQFGEAAGVIGRALEKYRYMADNDYNDRVTDVYIRNRDLEAVAGRMIRGILRASGVDR